MMMTCHGKLTADSILGAILLLNSVSSSLGLLCYQCTIRPPNRTVNQTRLCSQFDYSSRYSVDCPYSTFCMKKIFQLELPKGQVVTVEERDCAPQLYVYQTYGDDGRWHVHNSVDADAYANGCRDTRSSEGLLTPTTQHCFCSTALCNSAQSRDGPPPHTDAMAVIFMFNALKYIRSLR